MSHRKQHRRARRVSSPLATSTLASFLAILLLSCIALLWSGSAGQADDAPVWQRIDKKGIKSGSIQLGINDLLAITCPASLPTAQPRLILHVQLLQGAYSEHIKYNLRIVINDYRADLAMSAKSGSLYFDATDFNQRDMFQGLVQALSSAAQAGSDHAQLAIFSLGWRGDMPLAGADQVLNGLMDGCGE
jgi:hypothetical protein